MKTILEHLESFSEPIRSKALNNLYSSMKDKPVQFRWEALICGFYWQDTPEKFQYWELICRQEQLKQTNQL